MTGKPTYEQIVATSSDLIALIDINYIYQAVNAAFLKAYGKNQEEIVGHPVPELIGQKVFEERTKAHLNRCLDGEKTYYQSWLDFPGLGRRYMDIAFYPFLDDDGSVSGVVVNSRDITRTTELETQLRQAQKMEAMGTLAGGIAHDFNNILGAIIGYTELVQMDVSEGGRVGSHLRQVLKAANRAKDLVKQILAFSRQSDEEEKPVQLGPIIRETLKMLRASIPATIEIHQDIREESGTVLVDPTQIYQVLMNLCTNAAYAMRERGGILGVSLQDLRLDADTALQYSDLKPGPYVLLTVTDTGHGMDQTVKSRIFDPYFTTKDKGVGTGLGLAAVHGIVTRCGGTVVVDSEPGEGTTFDVFVPRIETQAAGETQPLESLPRGTECILFVDDEEALIDIGRQMLERLGYQVCAIANPVEALEVFMKQPGEFDLVITDQTMPHMTGEMLGKEIMRIRSDVAIILCTGYSELISDTRAKALGIREFVMKPLVIHDLARTIRIVLDKD
jgi:PAS domain S-box-containing protein